MAAREEAAERFLPIILMCSLQFIVMRLENITNLRETKDEKLKTVNEWINLTLPEN